MCHLKVRLLRILLICAPHVVTYYNSHNFVYVSSLCGSCLDQNGVICVILKEINLNYQRDLMYLT